MILNETLNFWSVQILEQKLLLSNLGYKKFKVVYMRFLDK